MPQIEQYIGHANLLRDDLSRIARQLEEAAQAVDQARRAPQDIASQIKQLNTTIEDIESQLTAEIATETTNDLSSKLKFPNTDARKAELGRRSRDHTELQSYLGEKRLLEMQKLDADVRLQGASDTLKAYTTVAALKHGEVELLTMTMRGLIATVATDEMIATVEKAIVGRLSESLKSGRMRVEIKDLVTTEIDAWSHRPAR